MLALKLNATKVGAKMVFPTNDNFNGESLTDNPM